MEYICDNHTKYKKYHETKCFQNFYFFRLRICNSTLKFFRIFTYSDFTTIFEIFLILVCWRAKNSDLEERLKLKTTFAPKCILLYNFDGYAIIIRARWQLFFFLLFKCIDI